LFFAVLGVAGGAIGSLFVHLNVKWTHFRLRTPCIKDHPVREIVLLTLATVLAGYFVGDMGRLNNTEILAGLFKSCESPDNVEPSKEFLCQTDAQTFIAVMLYTAVSKFALSVLTFGVRVPAGLFVPALTIGAVVGRLLGVLVRHWSLADPNFFMFRECGASSSHCIEPSMYAIIGAATVLGGVTQVSVSIAVIIFELTGSGKHLLPVMTALLFSKFTCGFFGAHSIYDTHINIKRYPFLDKAAHIHDTTLAAEIMREPTAVIPASGFTIGDLERLLSETMFFGFPVVNNERDMRLVGNIVRPELSAAIKEARRERRATDSSPVVLSVPFDESFPEVDFLRAGTAALEILTGRRSETEAPEGASESGSVTGDSSGRLMRSPLSGANPRASQAIAAGSLPGPLVPGEVVSATPLDFSGYLDAFVPTVSAATPVGKVHAFFAQMGFRSCMVTARGRLAGVLSRKDLIAFLDNLEDLPKKYFL